MKLLRHFLSFLCFFFLQQPCHIRQWGYQIWNQGKILHVLIIFCKKNSHGPIFAPLTPGAQQYDPGCIQTLTSHGYITPFLIRKSPNTLIPLPQPILNSPTSLSKSSILNFTAQPNSHLTNQILHSIISLLQPNIQFSNFTAHPNCQFTVPAKSFILNFTA